MVGAQAYMGVPKSPTARVCGQMVLYTQMRGAYTPMAFEMGVCVDVAHAGSVTESDLDIYSCLLPFYKGQVLWLSVALLILSLKV